jgi:hypothetical protein
MYAHCMAMLNETAAMAIGGYSNGTACSQDTYILNTITGNWTQGPPLNVGRVDQSCGSVRIQKVYCLFFWLNYVLIFQLQRKHIQIMCTNLKVYAQKI